MGVSSARRLGIAPGVGPFDDGAYALADAPNSPRADRATAAELRGGGVFLLPSRRPPLQPATGLHGRRTPRRHRHRRHPDLAPDAHPAPRARGRRAPPVREQHAPDRLRAHRLHVRRRAWTASRPRLHLQHVLRPALQRGDGALGRDRPPAGRPRAAAPDRGRPRLHRRPAPPLLPLPQRRAPLRALPVAIQGEHDGAGRGALRQLPLPRDRRPGHGSAARASTPNRSRGSCRRPALAPRLQPPERNEPPEDRRFRRLPRRHRQRHPEEPPKRPRRRLERFGLCDGLETDRRAAPDRRGLCDED